MVANVEHSRLAWQRYTETGELARELLREHVYRAWRRCEGHGTSPHILTVRELPAAEVTALQGRERVLIAAARPYLRTLSLATGAERHAAMLGDRHAVLLDVLGDQESLQGPGRVPLPGALLSEEDAGANGVGSPLAEDGYVELVGPEHLIAGFHCFTWQGLPLRDPDGQVAGVIAVSLRRITGVRVTLLEEFLLHAAHGVEAALLRQRLDEHAVYARLPGEHPKGMLEALRQDLVQLETAARLRIERAARLLGQAQGEGALVLLQSAGECLDRFERAATCWQALAAGAAPDDPACAEAPERVELHGRLCEVAWLLGTEAAMHRASLVVMPHAPVYVLARPQELSRRLLRLLIEALQMVPPGHDGHDSHEIRIRVRLDLAAGRVEVRVAAAVDLSLSLPLAEAELSLSEAAP
jgi:transcriptional regulator of acetoin/glycerol metabolism